MPKKQVCVRTFPNTYTHPVSVLNDYLSRGFTVVICNEFAISANLKGNEYILEKEVNVDEFECSE